MASRVENNGNFRENNKWRMEWAEEKCNRHNRRRLHIIHTSDDVSSESSISSGSESKFYPLGSLKNKRRKSPNRNTKRDHLAKLFEKKKLRDKSLSEKLRTPFERKLNRTCWPIKLTKITNIKKKPREKRREKPTYRSLSPKRFSSPLFFTYCRHFREKSPIVTCSELEFLDDAAFSCVYRLINQKHKLTYKQVTPEMLMEVLSDPEHVRMGATLEMIIIKLRALNLDLNPILHDLKEEVSRKLLCAVKLGLVTKTKGYYKVTSSFEDDKWAKERFSGMWELWYRRMRKIRS